MVVEVTEGHVAVGDAANLKALAVHAADRAHLSALGDLGHVAPSDGGADADHVWLSITGLKAAALATMAVSSDDERTEWAQAYDGMIGYAVSKGWTSPDGTRVRAHIEP